MTFHRNLNTTDLHAPTTLLIENDENETIVRGDLLYVTGYNTINNRYKVRKATGFVAGDARAEIYGIATDTINSILDKGSMTTFGVVLNVPVVLTSNTSDPTNLNPLAIGGAVFVDNEASSSNLGRLVSGSFGAAGFRVEAGIIVSVVDSTTAIIFFLGLTSGLLDFVENRAFRERVPFDNSNWTNEGTAPDDENVLTLQHNLNTQNLSIQWYELGKGGDATAIFDGPIDMGWNYDISDPDNIIVVRVPATNAGGTLAFFSGYAEIIY